MMMGTKSAGPMRRTTSMTEFAPPDVLAGVAEEQEEAMAAEETTDRLQVHEEKEEEIAHGWIGRGYRARPHRRNSADFSAAVETAAFLHACGLCNRRLGPGRDTFMYKGEAAFCSLECRQQHITHEEWRDKCTVKPPINQAAAAPTPGRGRSGSKTGTGGTVAAA